MAKFLGTFDVLKEKVAQLDLAGEWRELSNGQKQFRARNGGILNWYESSGTLLFQGDDKAKQNIETRLSPILESNDCFSASSVKTNELNNKIFGGWPR